MSSGVMFKLLSLAIRTAAKPIGNYIKRQAKEHEGFRRFAIKQAQRVHWIDMRMRLGILHDPEAQQRMHEREQRAAEERRRKAEAPTVRTEAEQKKYDEQKAKGAKDEEADGKKKAAEKAPKITIRPLSDAKAIELGANFFSELFVFGVAASLILLESWRSGRKENKRRDDVAERLAALETEVDRLRGKYEPELAEIREKVQPQREYRWWNPAGWWQRTAPLSDGEPPKTPGEATPIPGNVPIQRPGVAVKPTSPSTNKPRNDSKAASRVDASTPATNSSSNLPRHDEGRERVDSVTATKKER